MEQREILFRGQCQNGVWVTGNLAIIPKGWSKVAAGSYISNASGMPFAYYVRPETVGQYTGLTDTYKVPIYEGDILESRASENRDDWKQWKVVFEDGGFCFENIEKPKRKKRSGPEQYLLCEDEINLYRLEVIGNIHDNPELLKEVQK